jgi:hypothetical protein
VGVSRYLPSSVAQQPDFLQQTVTMRQHFLAGYQASVDKCDTVEAKPIRMDFVNKHRQNQEVGQKSTVTGGKLSCNFPSLCRMCGRYTRSCEINIAVTLVHYYTRGEEAEVH